MNREKQHCSCSPHPLVSCWLFDVFLFYLKIAVEVEDDYPDGIVQAEEEEEERDEQDAYPGGAADVFRSRERVPRNYGIGRSLLDKKSKTSVLNFTLLMRASCGVLSL